MQTNLVRTSESLTDDVLLADGWNFSGMGLYARPDRQRNAACTQEQALKETMARHIVDSGDSWLTVYGENPTNDQLLEMVGVLTMILEPDDKIQLMEEALAKIQLSIEEYDGRVEQLLEYINGEIRNVAQSMGASEHVLGMRSDFPH